MPTPPNPNAVTADPAIVRRLPVGAEVQPAGGVHFRVWAPRRKRVEVLLDPLPRKEKLVAPAKAGAQFDPLPGPLPRERENSDPLPGPLPREREQTDPRERERSLEAEGNGYFSGFASDAAAGTRYRYRLDDENAFPDPASRFQPEGPHGPSQVVDPDAFEWSDAQWRGPRLEGQVIYEMHVGTFTPEGTWQAASALLPQLAADGITTIELMPVADFCGRFGWGYDGVDLFAPTRLYGTPDELRRFVDRAHAVGIAVILDVVYNHFGPDGAYHREFSEHYYSDRYENEWGEPINFDGEHSAPVREFFVANAGYWIEEFHLDGLRLDATQQMFDASPQHIVADITRRVREAARGRSTLVIAENEPQHVQLARSIESGGQGLDALWNDDFHRAATVAVTGKNPAYFSDYLGTPQELVSAVKWGYLYQGQRFAWQKKRRGSAALGVAPATFVNFIENHDQLANSAGGTRLRLLTAPGRYRAITALLLLAPGTPMLFQGQEFGASSPFLFFADHRPELAERVRDGRAEFMSQFPGLATAEGQALLHDPADERMFERCKLDWGERQRHAEILALHRELLRLRRSDPALRHQRPGAVDGAVLAAEAFVIRYFRPEGQERLLLVNLGRDLHLASAPEPLLAPVAGTTWETLWSSEEARFGGGGAAALETDEGWRIPGHAAVVLFPKQSP